MLEMKTKIKYLIIGIVLLFGEFGKSAGALNDIDTAVSNNSDKITNVNKIRQKRRDMDYERKRNS